MAYDIWACHRGGRVGKPERTEMKTGDFEANPNTEPKPEVARPADPNTGPESEVACQADTKIRTEI